MNFQTLFFITTAVAISFFGRLTTNPVHKKHVFNYLSVWMLAQAVLALSDIYLPKGGVPITFFVLGVAPTIGFIIYLFKSPYGTAFRSGFSLKNLTIFHVIRIPVEIALFLAYQAKEIPVEMTFSGRNFDILAGISAPIVYFLFFKNNQPNKKALLIWNIACVVLLANIVFTAILSAETPFQVFGKDQPNNAVFHFPFVWLPTLVVPLVILAHVESIKRLRKD